jgi:hypothetical protein
MRIAGDAMSAIIGSTRSVLASVGIEGIARKCGFSIAQGAGRSSTVVGGYETFDPTGFRSYEPKCALLGETA